MPLMLQHRIYRQDLKKNPGALYVFGDNVARKGLGGQAKEMRGEPNAVGIATKWYPSFEPGAYFSDDRFDEIWQIIMADLKPVFQAIENNKLVVWPDEGIGTGLSRLPQKAPKIAAALVAVTDPLFSGFRVI